MRTSKLQTRDWDREQNPETFSTGDSVKRGVESSRVAPHVWTFHPCDSPLPPRWLDRLPARERLGYNAEAWTEAWMYVVLYTVRGRTRWVTLADQDWRLISPRRPRLGDQLGSVRH